mgnify:FL=1|tara:strand:+ start:457 stop:876 length:420 start_codon:yes stop_codon:yes gene_type:complete
MSYKIISKFIKDISFEIPNPKTFVLLDKEIKNYRLTFDIKSKPFKDNIVEVNTILKLVPGNEVKDKMLTEINLTALVTIDTNIKDKKEIEKIILVKIPNEIYPTLYETFLYIFKQAGVKNIKIEKDVNFEKLYLEKFGS